MTTVEDTAPVPRTKTPPIRNLFLLGLLFSLAILSVGLVLIRTEYRSARKAGLETLHAIADLNAAQIAAWRRERLDDVGVGASGVMRRSVLEWRRSRGDETAPVYAGITDAMEVIRRHYRYKNAVLASPEGRIWITLDPRLNGSGCGHTETMARLATGSDTPVFGELFACGICGTLHADVAAAVRDEDGIPVAVLLLRTDPEDFLFPLVETWPTPSQTAETLLVRRAGEDAQILNRRRNRAEPALSLRIPLATGIGPAAEAARGRTGVLEGEDDSGVFRLSVLRAIPASPWWLVTTVERDDVLAGARRNGRWIAMSALLLVLLTGVGLGLHYKHVGKRAYAALYTSERVRREELEEFRLTLYGIGDGVISGDAQGRVRRMNTVAEQLTGWTEAEAAGKPISDIFRIINESTREPVESPVDRVLREGGVAGLANHTLLLARDGTECPIADSGAAIEGEDGTTIGVVLVFRDQTPEREARRKLEREHENLNAVLSSAPVAMLIVDDHERVIEANPAAEHLFERTLETLKKRRCGDLLGCVNRNDHPEGCGRGPQCANCLLNEAVHAVLAGDDATPYREAEAWVDSPAGPRQIWFRFSAAAVELDGRRHVVMALHDITHQHEVEGQLRQAQKMEAVGRLAGGVAHDFNNMLEVILGHAELAGEQPDLTPTVREDLQEIIKAAKRSADLTRQLLAFARRQTVSPRALDLNATVPGMLTMLRRLIREDLELIWRPGPDLGVVEMDPAQVDQILANLVVNARDAIDGAGEIIIETRNATHEDAELESRIGPDPQGYIVLSVRDNGRGMEQHVLEHIFEPFFTTKGVGEGTGLGLATVYGIICQNRGVIRVESVPGTGSVFTIFLPRGTRPAPQATPSPEIPRAHGIETVLIVEDEEAILTLGKRTLERYGYTVLAASTPDQALKLARSHANRLDLLLTDMIMPGMNGRELSAEILRLNPDTKILFMSGYTANVIVHQGILEAGLSFLQKPFSTRTLAEKVRETIDG